VQNPSVGRQATVEIGCSQGAAAALSFCHRLSWTPFLQHRTRQLQERLRVGAAWQGEKWGDLVFTDELGGPLSGYAISRRFQNLLSLAGLPRMRYHDLRHGAASIMAVQGVPARVAMEVLGHAQISTTMNIYAHVAPELQREAADKVASALWASN
jgi:integrase